MSERKLNQVFNKLFIWKNVSKKKSKEIKSLKKRIKELEISRDNWKTKAESRDKAVEELKKKESKKVHRYKYCLSLIRFCIQAKTLTSVSFRAIVKIVALIETLFPTSNEIPAFNSVLIWYKKVGLYQLNKLKERANDWILIIDESIQFGNKKLLVIYGLRRSLYDFKSSLKFSDLTPLHITSMVKCNGELVKIEIEKAIKDIGNVIYSVCDHGSDIRKALKMLKIPHIHDITHFAASILKKLYSEDNEYLEFSRKMTEMRNQKKQTELAHICPPAQRTKSRFLNLRIISKWGTKCLALKINKNSKEYNELIWLRKYENFLLELHEINSATLDIFKIVKSNGLNDKTIKESKKKLKRLKGKKGKFFRNEMIKYFDNSRSLVGGKDNLLCTSDIIESSFGKMKNIISSNPMAAITDLALSLATFTCDLSEEAIKEALENTKMADLKKWTEENIGDTVYKKRKAVFS